MNFKYGSLTGSRFLHLCYIGWEAGGLFSSWVTFDILIHSDSSLKPPHRPDCCSYTRPWENRRWRAASIQTPLVANSRCIHGRCEVAVPHACQMLVGPQACATSVRGKLCHTTGFQKLHVSHLAFRRQGVSALSLPAAYQWSSTLWKSTEWTNPCAFHTVCLPV